MNLRDLQYLVTLAEVRNFNKAAVRCFVSQPTLSAQLKKLEVELGIQLFERRTKQSLLTPIGEKIVKQAQVILREVTHLKETAQLANDPWGGNLRLGIIPTLGPYFLPQLLPLIKKQFPKLKIILREAQTHVIVQELQRGELDTIILALPIMAAGLQTYTLFSEQFYLALPRHHRLAKQQSIALSDIQQENLLLLEEGHCLRDQILDVCALQGIKENSDFHATSLETLVQLVVNGSGITLLPELACPHFKSIAIKPFRKPVPNRTIGMLWHKQSARARCCNDIAVLLHNHFK